MDTINNTTEKFKLIPNIDKTIASRYDQKLEDVQEWLSLTEWSQEVIDEATVNTIQNKLLKLDIIPKKVNYDNLVKKL